MKCLNCGVELSDDAKFCSNCGVRMSKHTIKTDGPIEEDPAETSDIGAEQPESSIQDPNAEHSSPVIPFPEEKSKSKIREFWRKLSLFEKFSAISIVASLILGLIAFLAGRIFAGIIAIVWLAVVVVALLMEKNIIKVSRTRIPFLSVILSFILIIPYFSLFRINVADNGKYAWSEVILAYMLPAPESPYGEIISNSESSLILNVNKTTQEQYIRYIEACEGIGFIIETDTTSSSFHAFNEQGYEISLVFSRYSDEMQIKLSAGMELSALLWPNSELAQMLPVPESMVGIIQQDDEMVFLAYVGDISIDTFIAYVEACEDNGFTVDSDKSDKHFSAKNADGYKLSVDYQGNSIISISLCKPKYIVTIEVECAKNLFFSTYDVDVYINDSFEGTIAHGNTETFEMNLVSGTYTLKFVNHKDDELYGEVKIYVQKDERLKYKIICSSSGIDVETIVGTTKPNEDSNQQGTTDFTLDYPDAASLEKALNDGVKVTGKTVQFDVVEYMPDSAFGVNCWSGEHLNFISDKELDIGKGNIIVGRITAEPTKVLGSWIIPYEVLYIGGEIIEEETNSPTVTPDTQPTEITLTMSEDEFKGMKYQEAEKKFREMGFTNFEYRTVDTENESAADTICYIEITEWFIGDSDFVKGDKFDADSTVTFFIYKYEAPATPSSVFYSTNDYETATEGCTGVFSYRSRGSSYDIYWIIDFDEGYAYYFTEGNGNSSCDRLRIESGTLNDAVTITYHDGGNTWSYRLHFKYVNHPETLVLIDHNGFDWEYSATDLDDALRLRSTKTIMDY